MTAKTALRTLRQYQRQIIHGSSTFEDIACAMEKAVEDAFYEGLQTGLKRPSEADFSNELLWLASNSKRQL